MPKYCDLSTYTGNNGDLIKRRGVIRMNGFNLFQDDQPTYDFAPIDYTDETRGYWLMKSGERAYRLIRDLDSGRLTCSCESFECWSMCKHSLAVEDALRGIFNLLETIEVLEQVAIEPPYVGEVDDDYEEEVANRTAGLEWHPRSYRG